MVKNVLLGTSLMIGGLGIFKLLEKESKNLGTTEKKFLPGEWVSYQQQKWVILKETEDGELYLFPVGDFCDMKCGSLEQMECIKTYLKEQKEKFSFDDMQLMSVFDFLNYRNIIESCDRYHHYEKGWWLKPTRGKENPYKMIKENKLENIDDSDFVAAIRPICILNKEKL